MNYKEISINGADYKLRLNTRGCIECEKQLGKNPLLVFSNMSATNIPPINELAVIFNASLKPYHKTIKVDEAYDLIDAIIEDKGYKGFIELIVEVLQDSGLIPRVEDEEEELKN